MDWFFSLFSAMLAKIKTPHPGAFRKFLGYIFLPKIFLIKVMKTDFLGWVFFSVRFEASLKKKPTPWGFSRGTLVPITSSSVHPGCVYILGAIDSDALTGSVSTSWMHWTITFSASRMH